jgi:hypothetical protein
MSVARGKTLAVMHFCISACSAAEVLAALTEDDPDEFHKDDPNDNRAQVVFR